MTESVFKDLNPPYDIIVADPPWFYNNRRQDGTRFGRGAWGHYNLMTQKDIKALPIHEITNSDALLFLWATFPKLEQALDVIKAWGFCYKTVGFFWVKTVRNSLYSVGLQATFPHAGVLPKFGTGYYTKSNPEVCLLAAKGKAMKPVTDFVSNLIVSPIGKHSEKPSEMQYRIDAMYPNLRKVELFARRQYKSWDTWGK